MPPNISERAFEDAIERALLASGYQKRTSIDYDTALCLIPADVRDFLIATQPDRWARLREVRGAGFEAEFMKRLSKEIASRGTLDVLRKGIRDWGVSFKMVHFKPASTLNPDAQRVYEANRFSVLRQFRYKEDRKPSLDLGIFVNGLPIFTAELKNPYTGQNAQENAIAQYRRDRDPREPLFAFGRCLAHFAVDLDAVHMTTHLRGRETRFLPFNKGFKNGAGNPPNAHGFASAYLWEEIWAPDSVLDLLQNFAYMIDDLDDGRPTGTQSMVFPRYHQLDTVRRLVEDAREGGPGSRYLIQHSAGSGKSFTIAWLAHQLSSLHDDQDERVFDSIIVITDRRVLDQQLQQTIRQFEQVRGVVENIDKTSRQLKQALEDGKNIIVTTLQKFPVIASQVEELAGQRFAIIVDEAHSSQTGESVKSMKSVLRAESLEDAESQEPDADEVVDFFIREAEKRGQLPNASTFAFTATPKARTLELFGTPGPDGTFRPFSIYAMRQAIEEGFILDVLENYTTYRSYWELLKTIEDDPRYDKQKAQYLLKRFVELHPDAIRQKVAIMVDHFAQHVAGRIGGRAKAMIVTRSRLHAVRYRLALDAYLREQGYPFRALVAFSGTVEDGGKSYTEANMNGFPDSQTVEAFERNENRFMVVANKFQTGFDQPLLYVMYVDKILGGVGAVQTLSRLNRIHSEKDGTMVLDFANDAEKIQAAFQPYYETTLLSEGTDPNLIYDLDNRLQGFHLYTWQEVERVAEIYYRSGREGFGEADSVLRPVIDRYDAIGEDEQTDFRAALKGYVRLYRFLSQVAPFADDRLEMLYVFANLLHRRLEGMVGHDSLPLEVQQNVDIDSYRIHEQSSGSLALNRGESALDPQSEGDRGGVRAEETESLSRIIEELNERFGDLGTEYQGPIQELDARIAQDERLASSAGVNPRDNVRLTFNEVMREQIMDMIDTHFSFYKQVDGDKTFANTLYDMLFERYWRQMGDSQG